MFTRNSTDKQAIRDALEVNQDFLAQLPSSTTNTTQAPATTQSSPDEPDETDDLNEVDTDADAAAQLTDKNKVFSIAILDSDLVKEICSRNNGNNKNDDDDDDDDDEELGKVVLVSEATLQKQKRKHPEIGLSDYALLQEALDRGEVVREVRPQYQYGHFLIFFLRVTAASASSSSTDDDDDDNNNSSSSSSRNSNHNARQAKRKVEQNKKNVLKAVVKATAQGDQVYLLTMYYTTLEKAYIERSRSIFIRRGEGGGTSDAFYEYYRRHFRKRNMLDFI